MARIPGAEAVYEVADLFRQRCLIESSSLMWPGKQVWTVENLHSLCQAFIEHPDTSKDGFITKLEQQLQGESLGVHQIAVDLAVIYGLFPTGGAGGMGPSAKIKLVEDIRALKLSESIPDERTWQLVQHSFQQGIGSSGTHYLNGRPFHFAFYLLFGREVKKENIDPSLSVTMKTLVDRIRVETKEKTGHTPGLSRNMILHLLFPEHFERIASEDNKRRILTTLGAEAGIPSDTDVDDGLFTIRNHILTERGVPYFDFYDPEVKVRWGHLSCPNLIPSPRAKPQKLSPRPMKSQRHHFSTSQQKPISLNPSWRK